MTLLSAAKYGDLCVLVGDALAFAAPKIQPIGRHVGWPVGVYLLGHRHPVTNKLVIDYVGSAFRNDDVSSRTAEHLADRMKGELFTDQVVLPLKSDLHVDEVRRLEGVVARALGVPRWLRRVPGGRQGRS